MMTSNEDKQAQLFVEGRLSQRIAYKRVLLKKRPTNWFFKTTTEYGV